MRSRTYPIAIAAALTAVALASPSPAAGVEPVPSLRHLVTGNGFGFQVFDLEQNAIVQFLEHPYRFVRPNPSNPDGDGLVRRDLAYDTYFGIRVPGVAGWIGKMSPDSVGYLDETNIIRTRTTVGDVVTESFFWAPYGYAGNAMVMVLRATNEGDGPVAVEAFSLHNFKLGTATNPDAPGDDGEAILFADGAATETGPGGGAMVYLPIGGADISSCATDSFARVQQGDDLVAQTSCTGYDRVNAFQKSLGTIAAGESATWGVVVLFDEHASSAGARSAWQAFAGDRDAAALLAAARAEWEEWRSPAPTELNPTELAVWRQSEAVLRMGQVLEPWTAAPKRKNHGMILASLPPGNWHVGWVRDATYAIVALARAGHYAEAKAALDFFLDAEANKYGSLLNDVTYRISTVRYFGNGEEEADYSGHPTRNIEIDGWGLFLWAARVYIDESGDVGWLDETTRYGETVYDVIRDEVAEALAANLEPNGMAIADASIWEVHWANRQHFLYTTATTARGLCDMAALARRRDQLDDRDRYRDLADRAVDAIRGHFVDADGVLASSVEKLATGANYRDGAVVETFNWRLIPPTDPIAHATLGDLEVLATPAGGYSRLEGSGDPYDTDEWVFVDLRAADVFRASGQSQRADELLDWVVAQAAVNANLIPELYNTGAERGAIGAYTGSIPMVGYGAGLYLLSVLERGGSHELYDCGTAEPVDGTDAGPTDAPDAGGYGGGADAGAVDDGGPGGCGCQLHAHGRASLGQLLPLLLVVGALSWRRPRRRRRSAAR